ncbi:MAG: phosphoglycerate dehydrogenase, partial [Chloroflexi bacterium]|nr:phosphoglycerate dehydrogenase [Chloroflexota bacterium]
MKVLVTESLGEIGMSILRQAAQVDYREDLSHEDLKGIIDGYDALVVRSRTEVTADLIEAGAGLRVIGRAGTGVDNIDMDAATRQGIMVVNAPTGNSNAVAEHTIALMLALARQLYPAVSLLKAGRWEKSALKGIEVKDRKLGLVGFGRIGALVASKARGLEMRVGAFDPYIPPERAAQLGIELLSLDELLGWADFISVHTPLTPETRGLLGAEQLAKCKRTAFVINCARGGIIDEPALKDALEEKRLAGAALDVFEVEPAVDNELARLNNVIVTPHVAASTKEAQENVAHDVALAVVDALSGRIPVSPVNVPYLPPHAAEFLGPYIDLAQRLGSFFLQWRGELAHKVELVYDGEICEHDTRVLTSAFLSGLLASVSDQPVNVVNAAWVAEQRGLVVSEVRHTSRDRYSSQITARFPGAADQNITGALLNDLPHL